MNPDGTVDRYKAQLVTKGGYNQVEGVNYYDSFSPMAKLVTIRLLLATTASKQWILHQVDFNNAFLHGYLEEEVFMHPPPIYNATLGLVCKFNHSLYRLKQASRQ